MLETWRWFGPNEPITLSMIKQTGAKGIVTALHEIPIGEVWSEQAIAERKALIEDAGLVWSVVESVPLHNDIKTRSGNYVDYIENYKQSLINLGRQGVKTVCYNFMPVVDWIRTDLSYTLSNSAKALRFDLIDFIVLDLFILEREGAATDYSSEQLEKARIRYGQMKPEAIAQLERNVVAGLPGAGGESHYTRASIKQAIQTFQAIGTDGYRQNLYDFLQEVMPTAERAGVKLCIHPDDPPFALFGLPRVASTLEDLQRLVQAVPSPCNGITLCAGSLGARAENDLVQMVQTLGEHIFFVHLRNVKREPDGSFYESDHLAGDNDMLRLVSALLTQEKSRSSQEIIPMRPDHGHLFDLEEQMGGHNPGYSYLGRLRALAELRGVIHAMSTAESPAIPARR